LKLGCCFLLFLIVGRNPAQSQCSCALNPTQAPSPFPYYPSSPGNPRQETVLHKGMCNYIRILCFESSTSTVFAIIQFDEDDDGDDDDSSSNAREGHGRKKRLSRIQDWIDAASECLEDYCGI
ncbi:hypothetical protein OESDEN_24810, partial [Oesophagostomum dentatum]